MDEEIIQEATEAVEKGLDAGYAVEPLLRIVKSQKAEVERLQAEEKALLITIEKMRNEIRRLQNILVNFMDEIYAFGNKNNVDTNRFAQVAVLGNERDSVVKQIKSEAYREFADLLKSKADRGFWQEHSYVDTEDIDNTLKELTEKNDLEGKENDNI